jgi:hypothetical protein
MSQFLESTWPLWWIFALAMIFRWFHVVAASSRLPEDEIPEIPETRTNHSTAIDFS